MSPEVEDFEQDPLQRPAESDFPNECQDGQEQHE